MNDDDTVLEKDELTALKERANLMGLKYHPSISLEKLREKVNAAVESNDPAGDSGDESDAEKAPEETEGQMRQRLRRDALRLVRVRMTCMNPAKKEWNGEIFTVGNSVIGSVRKFVPFGNDEGWHIPHVLYEVIRDRTFPNYVTVKLPNGVTHRQHRMVKEFAIEILPALTQDELDELARRQAMGHSVD